MLSLKPPETQRQLSQGKFNITVSLIIVVAFPFCPTIVQIDCLCLFENKQKPDEGQQHCIAEYCSRPVLPVGGWLFQNTSSYTVVLSSSNFSGFAKPDMLLVLSRLSCEYSLTLHLLYRLQLRDS